MSQGLTLRDLERLTGVSNAYLSQLEIGKARNPTLTKVRVLARFFNVDPSNLFAETIDTSKSYPIKDDTIILGHSVGFSRFGDGMQTETIRSVAAMQLRAGSLFSEMIQGKIAGYRVEMDRSVHPAAFHITTWKTDIGSKNGRQLLLIDLGLSTRCHTTFAVLFGWRVFKKITVGQFLLKLDEMGGIHQLLMERNFGKVSLNETIQALVQVGVSPERIGIK